MPAPKPSDRFQTTAWSLIQAMKNRDASQYLPAMNRFIAGYWKPVFYFLRARGCALHQAEDLTQEFFARCLEGDWIQRADPRRGKFRALLLTVLKGFLSDQGPKRAPRQKKFERQLVSIEGLVGDAERAYEPATNETPDEIFMKRWAAALVESVLARLREDCERLDRPLWYQVFVAVHYPASHDERPSQQALAGRLGVSREQVRYGLEQATQRFRQHLRQEVRDQVGPKADVGQEIRELMALLGG